MGDEGRLSICSKAHHEASADIGGKQPLSDEPENDSRYKSACEHAETRQAADGEERKREANGADREMYGKSDRIAERQARRLRYDRDHEKGRLERHPEQVR